MAELSQILGELSDPDILSAFFPLILILAILSSTVCFLIFLLFQLIKFHFTFPRFRKQRSVENETIVIPLNRNVKLRYFFNRVLMQVPTPVNPANHEIDDLRAEIEKLRRENGSLRAQSAKSLQQISGLQGELTNAHAKAAEDKKAVEVAQKTRARLQEKAEQFERQLQEVLKEVERMYRTNKQFGELNQIGGKLGTVVEIPPERMLENVSPSTEKRLSDQAKEIEDLKALLQVCKKQMLELRK